MTVKVVDTSEVPNGPYFQKTGEPGLIGDILIASGMDSGYVFRAMESYLHTCMQKGGPAYGCTMKILTTSFKGGRMEPNVSMRDGDVVDFVIKKTRVGAGCCVIA